MDVERELKYSTVEDHVPSHAELIAAVASARIDLEAPVVERYVDVYYDTRGSDLRAAGVALRRRHRPSGVYATMKGDLGTEGNLYSRTEVERPVEDGEAWPRDVLDALPRALEPSELVAVAELWVVRVSLAASRGGSPVAELAFDSVECRSPGSDDGTVSFNEVEIEAKSDAPGVLAAMEALAEAVGELVPLTPSSSSKLDRAMALLSLFD